MKAIAVYISAIVIILITTTNTNALDRETLKWMRRTPKINKIEITGNKAFTSSEIREQMYSLESNWWRVIKGDRRSRLRRESLRRDTLEIKYMYFKEGYLGVQVREHFSLHIKGTDSSKVNVNVLIKEGKQFTAGPASITGNYATEWQGQLERYLREIKPANPIDPFLIHQITYQIRGFLANEGYPRATVTNIIDTANCQALCPIVFEVTTDSLVRFGQVSITGTEVFPEYVARRELKIKPGEKYRHLDIADSQRRLYEAGYFTSFNLTEQPDSNNLYLADYSLRLRERKAHFLTATTGPVGQSDVDDLLWSFTFGFGKRNFLQTRRASFSADYFFSTGTDAQLRRNIYALKFTDPWFLGLRMPTTIGFELQPRVQSTHEQEYFKASWATTISTLKKIGRFVRLDFGMEYESVNITGIPEADIPKIKQDNGISERRKLYFAYRRDSRDNLFLPKRGSLSEFGSKYVGGFLGGDDNFFLIEATWARYQISWPGWVSATRFSGGWVKPFGNSETVPADDRLYLGGANSVRAFKEKSLGPLVGDSLAIGARYTLLFNHEFRWKTVQFLQKLPGLKKVFENFPLWQSLFFDVGNGFNSLEEIRLDNFALAYGTGIQMVSPAGPIRLDYARRIKTDRYAFDYRWHFTILYAF